MKNNFKIASYCHIKNNTIAVNGSIDFKSEACDFSTFIKAAYKNYNTSYPKFYKMDNLSKLAFMAAESLVQNTKALHSNTALVFSNNASSLDTDREHQNSIKTEENYFPSPAIFVYTLPNICMGEISIKHKLFSENCFFIFDRFNAKHTQQYSQNLLENGKANSALCGWVNFDNENYEAFLYLVNKNGTFTHSIEEITRLYKNK